ncbi:anthranilate synthase component II [Salibacter halophilus]|jgi:anthranilate synthase component 2|uniref:Aminodeoxychorismate/anthranilate synthase component II n=1 Tax=Salibacter halophilus TaxID=1803916 RepID=A0A6N6M9D4_9FLAO|nr:aminodeoxychorismate/anthranilate synthase component II [Salibacter halophilus]KAB1064776.1 aminodeoxychorismate/anthranilate synthase component II [Salibacter halophilus]
MNKSISVIDNYDSFTYNLVHLLEPLVDEVVVMRNDEIDWSVLTKSTAIVLSPGPELPQTAGKMMEVIDRFINEKPFLGVCLGMQGIVNHFNGELFNMASVQHGRPVEVEHQGNSLFSDIQNPTLVGLYHSWAADLSSLPEELKAIANWGEVAMAIEHKSLPVYGVQFHPESILSSHGTQIVKNWLRLIEK